MKFTNPEKRKTQSVFRLSPDHGNPTGSTVSFGERELPEKETEQSFHATYYAFRTTQQKTK